MNERFVYHASLGFCIAMAWLLLEKMNKNKPARLTGYGVLCFAIIAFSFLSLRRMPDWKTVEALDRSALKVSYNSARANHFFGILIWGKVYQQLPKDADPARKKAVLDSLKPYFDRALEILPSYNSANSMKAGVAAEYHKLDGDYEKLIKAFEEVNLTGTYEKFVLEYLHYVNPRVNNAKDARLLEAFYKRMIPYYEQAFKNTTLPGEYKSLLKEIQERLPNLQ
jgi:tetratricopeptide (TPR) repeat protein